MTDNTNVGSSLTFYAEQYITVFCFKNIKPDELVAILTLKGELVALAKSVMTSEEIMKKKGLAAKTDSVIIPHDVYPKM